MVAGRGETISIHSFWRTGSTWFWQKFRDLPGTFCFYEPYHYRLVDLTAADITLLDPSSWASGHQPATPYFEEYRELLKPDGGVVGFDQRLSVKAFFPEGGLEESDRRYLSILGTTARRHDRTAVFGFCRSLGRIGAISGAIGGSHILLLREPFGAVNSAIRQLMLGDYLEIALDPGNRSVLNRLGLHFPNHVPLNNYDPHAWARYYPVSTVTIALHLYLLGCFIGLLYADEVVEIERLEDDPDYCRRAEERIGALTGIAPVLSDCRVARDFSHLRPHMIATESTCQYLHDHFFSKAGILAREVESMQGATIKIDPENGMTRLAAIFERSLARMVSSQGAAEISARISQVI